MLKLKIVFRNGIVNRCGPMATTSTVRHVAAYGLWSKADFLPRDSSCVLPFGSSPKHSATRAVLVLHEPAKAKRVFKGFHVKSRMKLPAVAVARKLDFASVASSSIDCARNYCQQAWNEIAPVLQLAAQALQRCQTTGC